LRKKKQEVEFRDKEELQKKMTSVEVANNLNKKNKSRLLNRHDQGGGRGKKADSHRARRLKNQEENAREDFHSASCPISRPKSETNIMKADVK